MKEIYGPADVAAALGVTKAAVSNWLSRHIDYPTPEFCTPDGRLFWGDLRPWHDWYALSQKQRVDKFCAVSVG